MSKSYKLVICSTFRNASLYIERYINQIDAMVNYLRWSPRDVLLLLGYGDSIDDTGRLLDAVTQLRFDSVLAEVNHGGPVFNSVEDKRRFEQQAKVINKLWVRIPDSAYRVAYIEPDVIWQPQVMRKLLTPMIRNPRLTILAPMVMCQHNPEQFADTFSFRCNGMRFEAKMPYHEQLWRKATLLPYVDSVGSFFLMRGDVAHRVSFSPVDGSVGLCRQILGLGGKVYIDPSTEVYK